MDVLLPAAAAWLAVSAVGRWGPTTGPAAHAQAVTRQATRWWWCLWSNSDAHVHVPAHRRGWRTVRGEHLRNARMFRGAYTAVLVGDAALWVGPAGFTGLWVLWLAGAAVQAHHGATPARPAPAHPLADEARVLSALKACGLIKDTRDTDGTPLCLPGLATSHQVANDGTQSVTCSLRSVGLSAKQVMDRREDFITKLNIVGVPLERWVVDRDHDEPGRLRLAILPAPVVLTTHRPDLPTVASWRDPVRIGRDLRTGQPVTAPVFDQGMWLVCGQQGSGKTSGSRLLASHFAADPTATIYLVDGKGMRSDWYGLRGRCAPGGYVDRNMKDAPALTLALLRDVIAEMDARMLAGDRGETPGMLFLFEEQSMMRSRLATVKGAQEQMDAMMTEIVQGCRAGNICTNVIAQKPSAKQMSTDTRSQAGVVICHRIKLDDAAMVLGERPDGYDTSTLATGDALLSVQGRITPVRVDYVDDVPWKEFMGRWPAPVVPTPQDARQDTPAAPAAPTAPTVPPAAAPPPPEPTDTTPAPADQQPTEPSPLFWAALAIVRAHPDGEVAPTPLFNLLPDTVRPTSVMVLSVELKAAGWPSRLVRRQGVKVRLFAAADVTGTGGTGATVGASAS